MAKIYREGAAGALLDEYERAIEGLQQVLEDISVEELIKIVDSETNDLSCQSIQSILSHVVSAGYAFAIDIRQLGGEKVEYPDDVVHFTIKDYEKDLKNFFVFMASTFENRTDLQLEEFDNSKKIKTPWGQVYDTEQLMEHAIVHVLRHRRQIEKFKINVRKNKR